MLARINRIECFKTEKLQRQNTTHLQHVSNLTIPRGKDYKKSNVHLFDFLFVCFSGIDFRDHYFSKNKERTERIRKRNARYSDQELYNYCKRRDHYSYVIYFNNLTRIVDDFVTRHTLPFHPCFYKKRLVIF